MGKHTRKVTAKILHDAIAQKNLADRQAKMGKHTYFVAIQKLEPLAKALNGVAMPEELFTGGSANDRRVWCQQNGAVIVRVSDYCAKVHPQRPDNSLRARLIAWADIHPLFAELSYQRVATASKATEGDDRVYLYRVA